MAMNAYRNYTMNANMAAKAMRRLSSGFRINGAADDPAGLAVSEKMRAQIRGLNMSAQNARHSIAMLQTAEGGLNEVHAILQRMRELANQAANGTYGDDDRALLNKEYQAIMDEISRLTSDTHYNNIKLLNGSAGGEEGPGAMGYMGLTGVTSTDASLHDARLKFNFREDEPGLFTVTLQIDGKNIDTKRVSGSATDLSFDTDGGRVTLNFGAISNLKDGVITNIRVTGANVDYSEAKGATTSDQLYFQIGANGHADQRIGMHLSNMSTENLGNKPDNKTLNLTDILTQANARDAIDVIDKATKQVSLERAGIGAQINRLEHTINNLENTAENLTAAESRIRDADMAQEMMNFMKYSILMQVGQAMMAQAANLPKMLIQMLWSM
jgi:flagellin